ncbi:hypothetical protein [Dyella flagellata]|nr:hypothetical protein [Dyella flagellata]
MATESRTLFFTRSALVTLAYGLIYAALREISLSDISYLNWIPMAPLRFTCLLFVPTRYWPALIVGEAIPISYQNYPNLEQFGWPAMLSTGVPPMTYAAVIVHLTLKRLPNFEQLISKNMGSLLFCMLLVSLTVGLHNRLSYSLLKHLAPGEQPVPLWLYGVRRIIGNYLSVLTVTPVVLWLVEETRRVAPPNPFQLGALANALQGIPRLTTAGLLLVITLLTFAGHYVGGAVHMLALCGIVAALVVAASRHGWQCAVLVGAAANLGVIVLMPSRDDPLTILAQCMIAGLTTCSLLLGARTTVSRGLAHGIRLAEHNARLAEQSAAAARGLARRELFATERVRLNYATELDGVFDDMHGRAIRMMHEAHSALPPARLDAYYQDFEALHQQHLRITNGLAPHGRDLFDGEERPIVQALSQIGVQCKIFDPSFDSDPLDLSMELHPALHRLKCETVAYLMKHAPSNVLSLHLAVRTRDGHRVAEATLASVGMPITLSKIAYQDLLTGLGVTYASERRMRNQAQLYGGDVQLVHTSPHQLRVVVCVADKAEG